MTQGTQAAAGTSAGWRQTTYCAFDVHDHKNINSSEHGAGKLVLDVAFVGFALSNLRETLGGDLVLSKMT